MATLQPGRLIALKPRTRTQLLRVEVTIDRSVTYQQLKGFVRDAVVGWGSCFPLTDPFYRLREGDVVVRRRSPTRPVMPRREG
jgi:hypothetical protein